jgi:4-aminobutyrate aminotransferase/(S)-3-amino-2-methylpropionate transaminase
MSKPAINPTQPKDQRPSLRTPIPGPKSRALRAREDELVAPGLQSYAVRAGIAVSEASGSAVTDLDGNVFLDFIGGIAVNALGHSHPRYVKAVQDQVARASVGAFTSEARVSLLEKVAATAPAPKLRRLQLYSGGTEAVESALRLAKSHTGKYEFVSFWGGFHGKTMGALSLMGSTFKHRLGPLVPGSHVVPYADCYRCPVQSTYPGCGLACLEVARKQVKVGSAGAVAAVIAEPMQGTAGNVIPPKEFLPAVRDWAKELGALFIADEMITGLGRTGRRWGVEHTGVQPDIITLGKAFGGGFPVSGVLTTDEIAHAKPWSEPSGSSSSYGGNPLASAASNAALTIIEDERLIENAATVGAAMLAELETFVDRYPFVGFVSGAGLFLRVELVVDRRTKEPLPKAVTERIFQECVRRGLLTMAYAANFRLQPALTLDEATARNGLAVLAEVFDALAADGSWR